MQMIRRRGAAAGPIVEDRPAGPEILGQRQEGSQIAFDRLGNMPQAGDGEVPRENGGGIGGADARGRYRGFGMES